MTHSDANDSGHSDTSSAVTSNDPTSERDSAAGPGCMPAILAATVLMGIVGFISCGVSTWFLYQQRAEFASRTLESTLVPAIEQSRLAPDEKASVLEQLGAFGESLKQNEIENWQAAAVMQRLVRLPILEWGDIQAVEQRLRSDAESVGDPQKHAEEIRQFARLRRAVELDRITMVDFEDVLAPVLAGDGTPMTRRTLVDPIPLEVALEVAQRARLLADRSKVPDQDYDVELAPIVRRQIQTGMSEGSY